MEPTDLSPGAPHKKRPGYLTEYAAHAGISKQAASVQLKRVGINYLEPFDFAEARRAAVGIWPEEESLDDFTAWLRDSRKDRRPEGEID